MCKVRCVLVIAVLLLNNVCISRVVLPHVPDIMHPPIPEDADIDADLIDQLHDQDPEVRPGLFQGDMAMENDIYKYWRIGLRKDIFPEKLWLNKTVPYVISPLYDVTDYVTIYRAIRTINFMTCVKFIPWNGKVSDYLLIWPIKYPAGCWSFVGRKGGSQILSLQPPTDRSTNCLGNEGRAIHELMHALGIFHEHSRWDRDRYVKIHPENIVPRYKSNFQKQSPENTSFSFEYDFDSIMHYGKNYFSIGSGKPTITPKVSGVKKLGQRKGMSVLDCLKLNDLYGCLDNPKTRRKYFSICKFLGISS
ncbi:high choriolytic enzyme 1-like [Agrilus planipennis]|uniref:Metalloendopeptidase n=1 Tax=Agrilus planipennis TaxID=224129 RepID=A0A1W4XIF9_AGRPL|nr:high choriolytic enzyme 1-like [Agrilus planipennis]